jgi:hypothetical protein
MGQQQQPQQQAQAEVQMRQQPQQSPFFTPEEAEGADGPQTLVAQR